jgi:ferric-dicitrate binding protein FerR (iron transport regulator)
MADDHEVEQARRAAAIEWIARFGDTKLATSDEEAFFAWRRDPDNRRVWEALAAGRTPVSRFVVRPQATRHKVIDIWTGETAMIAMTAQDNLSEEDALHTARLLNRRAEGGDRSASQ